MLHDAANRFGLKALHFLKSVSPGPTTDRSTVPLLSQTQPAASLAAYKAAAASRYLIRSVLVLKEDQGALHRGDLKGPKQYILFTTTAWERQFELETNTKCPVEVRL